MRYAMPIRVRLSETDQDGVLTLFHLINYLQDSSTFHAEEVNKGLAWSRETHLAWVLVRWQLHIKAFPRMGDYLVVRTWPYSFRGFMGGRNYTIERENGEMLVMANSEWILMDMEKNCPARVGKDMAEAFGPEPKLEEDFGPRKITLVGDGSEREHFSIQEYHLDTNHHVNNGQYIHMAENYLDEGFVPVHFRAEYKKQAYLGDEVVPKVCKIEGGYQISLETTEGEAYFTAEFLDR
ncbi:MAG: thioesterase [Lachnospiraceae bacterium]|nr:thioesterase [Lachnospiraceae bacterium]